MQRTVTAAAAALLAGAGSVSAGNCYKHGAAMDKPFSGDEISTMRSYFMKNINIEGKGGTVAAPDYDTPGGSYYYHWMRDGALTMRCVQETSSNITEYDTQLQAYSQWVLHVQSLYGSNGIDIRTEPKFNLPNGDLFTDGWCRPQNDGPGLRAYSLMLYADALIGSGRAEYVTQYLWTGDTGNKNGGAIKYDLDYVVDGWHTSTCDLWEEYTNDDLFWNRITMKKAMLRGAVFAENMGDADSAATYRDTAAAIDAELYDSHWTGSYVQEATGRTKDGAVIVGFNDGFDDSDKLFAPTSFEVASTVNQYNELFCNEYSINTQDTANGVPGVLYGRYQGDSYAGGNPWQLITAALGNLFYRAANYVLDEGAPSQEALDMWATAFNLGAGALSGLSDAALAEQFAIAGDSVMGRLRRHVEAEGFHLAEQIDENSGVQMSAEDLTWSYAEMLNAMHSRDIYNDKSA